MVLVSVTSTTKVEVPVVFGLPEIAPVVLFKVSPVGRVPKPFSTDQVYGALPPLAVSLALYGCLRVAGGKDDVVTKRLNGKTTPATAGTA